MFNSVIGKVAASFIKVFNKTTDKLLRARWKMTNYKQLIFSFPHAMGCLKLMFIHFHFSSTCFIIFVFHANTNEIQDINVFSSALN